MHLSDHEPQLMRKRDLVTNLSEDFFGQSLANLEFSHLSTFLAEALNNRLRERSDMSIGRVRDNRLCK